MGMSLNVHNYVHDKDTNRMILQNKRPYKRFVKEGEVPIIVQSGKFYSDGGDDVKLEDVPSHVWATLRATTSDGLKALGLIEDDIGPPEKEKKEKTAPKTGSISDTPADERPPSLTEVIMSLDHSDDTEWTKGGLPDLNVVKERYGKYVSRQQVTDAVPDFKRKE
tara:strand:- start:344 stop:838 length:495 start_codon:yes stop_codon:yes gene_type:complete